MDQLNLALGEYHLYPFRDLISSVSGDIFLIPLLH